jgi:octaheme c-type cytochrome (tetrathionate reductase family)
MDSSLIKPNKALDVHMGTDGQNFNCTRCHSTELHNIAGRVYTTPATEGRTSLIEDDLASKITCESCHGNQPHKTESKPNDHTDKVACQSCHIPAFARVNPTKMMWDWSTAGKKKNGKPFMVKDELGKPKYFTKKGDMRWAKNVKPVYYWYNGAMEHLTLKDTIDPGREPVALNRPLGSKDDPNARIFPFKIHKARQPYDKVNKTISIPHLFPKGKDDQSAYWKKYDWNKAISFGQAYAGLPYSGEYDFVETSYVFPITHMVAPKDHVVACSECHTKNNSRLANLAGFYMPGRDSHKAVIFLGWALVIGTFAATLIHGLGRVFTNGGRKEE